MMCHIFPKQTLATYLSMNQCPGVRLLTELCYISHWNRVGAISHHYILSYLKHCTFRYNDPTEAANMRLNLSNSQHGQHLLGNHLLVIIIIFFFCFHEIFQIFFYVLYRATNPYLVNPYQIWDHHQWYWTKHNEIISIFLIKVRHQWENEVVMLICVAVLTI